MLAVRAFAEAPAPASPLTSAVLAPSLYLQAANAKNQLTVKAPWLNKEAYGALLESFCYNKAKASTAALFAIQGFFNDIGFPLGDKGQSVFMRTFEKLYNDDIMVEEHLNLWREDLRNPTPGHDRALQHSEP